MEILSTGEKIKRIRVYNGITLKELCGSEISISKMSCIENGKIEADDEILKYIAEKLNIDYSYLAKSVYNQIDGNIKEVEENMSRYDYEKELKFNLEYSIDYGYIDQSMGIVNKLFSYYKKDKKWDKISEIIPVYYELYSGTDNFKNQIMYLLDLGEYLYLNQEYEEASVYFAKIVEGLAQRNEKDTEDYAKACCELSKCNLKIGKCEKGEELLEEALSRVEYVEDKSTLCEIYHILAVKNILLKKYSKDNREYAYTCAGDDVHRIMGMKIDYLKCYFRTFNPRDAKNAIEEIIDMIPENPEEACTEEIVRFLKILKTYDQKEPIKRIIDSCLNIAIVTNNIILLEYSYYLKGLLLEEEGKFDEAEMNFNLSLDALARFGTKKDFYERYLDLGNLYHKLDNIKESVRYFCLAMDVKKKCNY